MDLSFRPVVSIYKIQYAVNLMDLGTYVHMHVCMCVHAHIFMRACMRAPVRACVCASKYNNIIIIIMQ